MTTRSCNGRNFMERFLSVKLLRRAQKRLALALDSSPTTALT
jgi:hypothetical protein